MTSQASEVSFVSDDEHLSFGVEPGTLKYRLRRARYPALAKSIAQFADQKHADQKQDMRILDVGVGRGRTFRYVSATGKAGQFDWYGLDISRVPEDALAGANHYRITLANIKDGLPYQDNFFDVLVAEQILEHLHDPDYAVSEMYRVTKPGGLLIIGVPVFTGPVASIRNTYIRWFPGLFKKSGSDHHQTFSLRSIRRLLLGDGLAREDCVRGFRILSGGLLRPLENYYWWYRFNAWLGEQLPAYCTEVQFCLRKS